MFNAVLTLRLARHGVDVVLIGFFAWIALLPTLKFAWAPLLDRFDIPGFGAIWGKRRGWIMLAQLGIFSSMIAMAVTSDDHSLPLTALFGLLLAFWTTTLEIAADGWRIELAPTKAEQAPLVAANLWGYRGAMIAAGSGAVYLAGQFDWTAAYLVIAAAAFLPFPFLCAACLTDHDRRQRSAGFITGVLASLLILLTSFAIAAALGWAGLRLAAGIGVNSQTNATPAVLALALLPFLALAAALPRIRRLPPSSPTLRSPAIGPYVEIFWRYGYTALPLFAFISFYRMGDVMTLTLSHPLWNARGYSLSQIAMADGAVAIGAALAGVLVGGWIAARWRLSVALVSGALGSAAGNWIFVWLWRRPPSGGTLYLAAGIDQFAHGLEATVFVVYLSMLVNPRHAGAQYAFLSGWALLLPRLISGAAGSIQTRVGYDGFFLLSGSLSAAAVLFLPLLAHARRRASA